MYKQNLALNNLQGLIRRKKTTNLKKQLHKKCKYQRTMNTGHKPLGIK